jgi:hypothetical protein
MTAKKLGLTIRKEKIRLLLQFAAVVLCAGTAHADITKSYDFSGTLASAIGGSASVTGAFTLDFTTNTISAYSFTIPGGTLASTKFPVDISFLTQFTATSPSGATFTELDFVSLNESELKLLFETPFTAFSGSTFYTADISYPGAGTIDSNLVCSQNDCGADGNSQFTSGSATPIETSTVPEPGTTFLLLSCVIILAPAFKRKLLAIRRCLP